MLEYGPSLTIQYLHSCELARRSSSYFCNSKRREFILQFLELLWTRGVENKQHVNINTQLVKTLAEGFLQFGAAELT